MDKEFKQWPQFLLSHYILGMQCSCWCLNKWDKCCCLLWPFFFLLTAETSRQEGHSCQSWYHYWRIWEMAANNESGLFFRVMIVILMTMEGLCMWWNPFHGDQKMWTNYISFWMTYTGRIWHLSQCSSTESALSQMSIQVGQNRMVIIRHGCLPKTERRSQTYSKLYIMVLNWIMNFEFFWHGI